MKKILIAYDTGYGTTAEIAQMIRKEILLCGAQADAIQVTAVDRLTTYDAVVVGSPIRLGRCTPRIKNFLKRNAGALNHLPIAFYFTCMSVIRVSDEPDLPFPLYVDPAFGNESKSRDKVTLMEFSHSYPYYLKHFLKLVPRIKPVSVAFFKGRLDLRRLSLLHTLIMKLAIMLMEEISEGKFINPDAVRHWSRDLYLVQFSSRKCLLGVGSR